LAAAAACSFTVDSFDPDSACAAEASDLLAYAFLVLFVD